MRKGSNGSIKSIRLLDYIEFSYILIAVREYKCDSPTSGCSAYRHNRIATTRDLIVYFFFRVKIFNVDIYKSSRTIKGGTYA